MTSAFNAGRLSAEEPLGDTAFLVLFSVQARWEAELHRAGTAVPAALLPLLLRELQEAFQG